MSKFYGKHFIIYKIKKLYIIATIKLMNQKQSIANFKNQI